MRMGKREKKPQTGSVPSPCLQAKTAFQPSPKKTPVPSPFRDSGRMNPSWRVSRMELADPYGWQKLTIEEARQVIKRLGHFESMTWNEILVGANKQNHSVSIDDLSKEARSRLEELQLDDLDELLSLRISGEERVWGILQEGVVLVLWWDPKHQVCPSLKKHT